MNTKQMLLPSERQDRLARQVTESGPLSVRRLAEIFSVSEATIRRDLDKLSDGGMVKRVRGGVTPPSKHLFAERFYTDRLDIEPDKKAAIARQALRHIQNGDFIFLDAGTTAYYLADSLSAVERCTVVTNDIFIANTAELSASSNMILTGGMLYAPGSLLMGPIAETFVRQIKVNTIFFTCDHIDIDWGISSKSVGEASMKKHLCKAEAKHILLADSTKFGKRSVARYADLSAMDLVIVDEMVERAVLDRLEERGIAYELAPVDPGQDRGGHII